jgi:hypothetical protein
LPFSFAWSHLCGDAPVINNHIYFCTVLGPVYVIDAERFDENSLVAVNDLGLPGKTWTLSPFSAADGKLFHRTS